MIRYILTEHATPCLLGSNHTIGSAFIPPKNSNFTFIHSHHAFQSWTFQYHLDCAAASIASSINCALSYSRNDNFALSSRDINAVFLRFEEFHVFHFLSKFYNLYHQNHNNDHNNDDNDKEFVFAQFAASFVCFISSFFFRLFIFCFLIIKKKGKIAKNE